jgi:hypothetical protein
LLLRAGNKNKLNSFNVKQLKTIGSIEIVVDFISCVQVFELI